MIMSSSRADSHTTTRKRHCSIHCSSSHLQSPNYLGGPSTLDGSSSTPSARTQSVDNQVRSLTSVEYGSKMLTGINQLRMSGLLCDCKLIAGGLELHVHKAVLVACSDYFRAMFTGEMKESREPLVALQGVSGVGLQTVIDFVYSGQLKLCIDTVEEVLAAASHLQVQDAIDLCAQYLDEVLDVLNCVDILKMAELFSLNDTQDEVRAFILRNFEQLGENSELNKLTCAQLLSLLSEDSLVISSEYRVFEFVLAWVEHDRVDREPHIAALMNKVRLPLLSGEELVERVSRVDMIRNNERCFELLCEAKDYHIVVNKQPLLQSARTQVRSKRNCLIMLYDENLECYDFELSRHFFLRDIPVAMYNACVCVIDNFMYVCGGKYDNTENEIATARCFRYDPRFDTWYECCSMNEARKDFAMVAFNGSLYSIAGQDEMSMSSTVEMFSIAENDWTQCPSLPNALSSHAAAACGKRIYVSGGQQFSGYSKTVLSLDPTTQEWREEPSMLTPRSNHCMVECNGQLIVIGGNIEDSYGFPVAVVTIEIFTPPVGTWTQCIATMSVREAGAVTQCLDAPPGRLGSSIYVVGGINGQHYFSDTIQAYYPEEDRVDVVDKLSTRINGRACCMLKMPQYIYM